MGLDQYAVSFPSKAVVIRVGKKKITIEEYDPQVDFKQPEEATEIFRWRKHPSIQGWMEKLYYDKGGIEGVFNCVPVRLTMDDLNKLERDIKGNRLPETEGFFFGKDDGTEIQEDLKFVYLAKQEIKEGNIVAYSSWW